MTIRTNYFATTNRTGLLRLEVENCPRCDGTGTLPWFSHRMGGKCMKCNGAKRRITANGKRAEARLLAAFRAAGPATADPKIAEDLLKSIAARYKGATWIPNA